MAGAVVALVAAVAVGGWMWLRPRGNEGAAVSAAPAAAQAKPLTEAQQQVAKARRILDEGDELNRETYVLAEELLRKAEAIDVTEGSAWGLHVRLSTYLHVMGLDRSPARLEAMQSHADRALKLAPDSVEAQIASAQAQMVIRQDLGGAQARLQALAARYPRDARILRELAWLFRYDDKLDEALAVLARAREIAPTDKPLVCDVVNCLILSGRFAEADGLVTQAMTAQPVARMLAFDVWLKLYWNGDLAGVPASLQRWPAWFLREDRGAGLAAMAWQWRGDAEQALTALGRLPRDYVRDYWFTGPRAVLSAWAHERAGHAEAARADWQIVVQHADRELAAAPDDPAALHWKAWALARLGDTATAERMLRLLEERRVARGSIEGLPQLVGGFTGLALMVGQKDRALDLLTRMCAAPVKETRGINRAALRNNPHFEPLRSDPRFQALVAAAPAPEETKAAGGAVTKGMVPTPDEKSLLVLPLENLSPDPENAFFTEGMHAEIIATLQRTTELRVIGRDSALAFKRGAGTVAEFAQRVGAANVLSGSVRRAGTKVRILLELRRARDDASLWSLPRPERELTDIWAVQSEIAEQIAGVLQARVAVGTFVLARYTTKIPEAYDHFVRAFAHFRSADRNAGTGLSAYLAAIENAERALALDPDFAAAAALLANAHQLACRGEQEPVARWRHAGESKRWAEAAARMVPGGAGDHGLASHFGQLERDYARGLMYAQNVARALPNESNAYNYIGIFNAYLERHEESLAAYRQAIRLDPISPIYWRNYLLSLVALRRADAFREEHARDRAATIGDDSPQWKFALTGELPVIAEAWSPAVRITWEWRARRFAEVVSLADAELKRSETKDLDRLIFLRYRCDSLQRLGRKEEAKESAAELMTLARKLSGIREVGPSQKDGWLAHALARLGQTEEAANAARRYVEVVRTGAPGLIYEREREMAELHAYLNRPRDCIELLAKLLRVPSRLSVPMLKVDPAWDNVREEPAFQALLADPKNSAPL